jgi:hypothetical protein
VSNRSCELTTKDRNEFLILREVVFNRGNWTTIQQTCAASLVWTVARLSIQFCEVGFIQVCSVELQRVTESFSNMEVRDMVTRLAYVSAKDVATVQASLSDHRVTFSPSVLQRIASQT